MSPSLQTAAVVALMALVPPTLRAKAPRIEDRIRGRAIAAASPPMESPAVRSVTAAAHMRDEDLVFGVTAGGRSRAYPWWVAKNFHVVDDVLGGEPVALAFCEQCSGAAAFKRTVAGRVLVFEVAGVYNGTIILRDRQTRSLWAPFSGRALEGPLAGRRLERLPLSATRWDEWTARHPRGDVVWGPPGAREGHGSWYEPGKWGIVSEMGATLQAWDPRLPENELVYGIETGQGNEARNREDSQGTGKAYPLRWLRERGGIVNDALAGAPVVVVARGALDVAGYDRRVKGRALTFRPSAGSQAVMNDDETGRDWSGEGVAVAGPLQGERLHAADGYVVEWHVWFAYHPDGEVAGLSDVATSPSALPAGLTFPALSLTDLGGRPRLLTFPGSVNVVVLWAAWCPACKDALPRLSRLLAALEGRGLSATGIAIHIPEEDEAALVRRFVGESRLRFPTLMVNEEAYDRLDALCRQSGGPGVVLPTAFVTDAGGKVLSVVRGKDVDRLPGLVEALLDRTKAADR